MGPRPGLDGPRVKHRCLLETETSMAPDHLCPDCGVLLQTGLQTCLTCRPAPGGLSAYHCHLAVPCQSVPELREWPLMRHVMVFALLLAGWQAGRQAVWLQAENVSPKNRMTALYSRLQIDSWLLFSSLFSWFRYFMPQLFDDGRTVDRLQHPLKSPQHSPALIINTLLHIAATHRTGSSLSTPVATRHETCHNCDGASNQLITYCSSD